LSLKLISEKKVRRRYREEIREIENKTIEEEASRKNLHCV